jgi:hypothetical protein
VTGSIMPVLSTSHRCTFLSLLGLPIFASGSSNVRGLGSQFITEITMGLKRRKCRHVRNARMSTVGKVF